MNQQLLNSVKNMIIDWANSEGVDLADHFQSRDDFAKWVISFTIKSVMDILSIELNAAYDIVMGDGSFNNLADSVWNQLQAS